MDYNNIEQKKKTIIKRLEQRRLNEALKMLGELATETSNWEIKSKIEAIEQSYKYRTNICSTIWRKALPTRNATKSTKVS